MSRKYFSLKLVYYVYMYVFYYVDLSTLIECFQVHGKNLIRSMSLVSHLHKY